MNWRLDVSLSTSSLNRTLDPHILFQINLSSGQIISFEMTLNTFHKLRFNVTVALKEIEDILNRSFFKQIE